MASLKAALCLGACLSAWIICTADINAPKLENIRWVSLDFKTILKWTATKSNHTYTVHYSKDNGDMEENPNCIELSDTECDLTNNLVPYDRTYTADIKTEPLSHDYDYILEELPHSYTPPFNPYRESNISAVEITVESVDKSSVVINITDPLTGIHKHGKQLTIRDILKNDLEYKISYYKSGSTGKRDIISNSTVAKVAGLDAGQSYCFMAAAFIPSRPKVSQQGAWSVQSCTQGDSTVLEDLSLEAWVGAVFISLTALIFIITVTVLCCRCCQQKNRRHTSQSSRSI